MKKTVFTFLASGLVMITGLKAQTIQEGKSHLYAKRYNSAKSVFEKLLAVNPNSIEATYWLGQSILEMDEIASSRRAAAGQLYSKALQTTSNAPLILVGMGHVDLLENKPADARQKFETALTMTKTKKGDDPMILTAIGRANVDAKNGDFQYAIDKLQAAADKGEKSAEVFLELGNAYRKARPGEGGGDAFKSYKKALEIDPKFAPASLRLAQLFESQKNHELILEYLNESVTRDPQFTAGYYELFYYYFLRQKNEEAEVQLNKYINSKPDKDIQDEFLYAQLCWVRKDFPCAITKAESVIAALGEKTKPKVYRLLADANFQKGDFTAAKKYSDLFFVKKNPDDYISYDHKLRAEVLSKTGGTKEEILNNYIQGVELDTTVADKIDFLKKAAADFKEKKWRAEEAIVIEKLIATKPKPIINDYFDMALAHYFTPNYEKTREAALKMIELYPDQIYGYEWAYNASYALAYDTMKAEATRDSLKTAITAPDALKMFDFAKADTVKYRKQYLSSIRYLAQYSFNTAKDKEKSIEYFTKWLEVDPANAEAINGYIEQIKKMPAPKQTASGTKPGASAAKPASTQTKPVAKALTLKTMYLKA